MPFTLAHPALVLPLARSKKFSLTALLAGCMVPDFEFFFQMREVENVGHHWYGILLFDLPAAIIFCYIFHNLLKHLLIINLPSSYRNKFISTIGFNWNAYASNNKLGVLLSLFIGILSHITWDAFTHSNGFFVLMIPVLLEKIKIIGKELPVYFLLQIFSSVLGMLLVYRFIMKMPADKPEGFTAKPNTYYWPTIILVFGFIVLNRVFIWPEYNSFWGVVMAIMGGFSYAWLLISLIFKGTQIKNYKHEHNQHLH